MFALGQRIRKQSFIHSERFIGTNRHALMIIGVLTVAIGCGDGNKAGT